MTPGKLTNDKHEWTRSSYSDQQGGNCVEWAPALAPAGSVPVRESKDPSRAPLGFAPAAWSALVSAVRRDELGN